MAIPVLWNEVLSGTSEEVATHKVLIWASLAGEALVAVGISLEIEAPLSVKKILSFVAVIFGVIISAAGTLLLLNFDESISGAQQAKIIALDTRLAPRGIKPDQRARIVSELSQYAGTRGTACIPTRGVMVPDVVPLANEIQRIFADAGWKAEPYMGDCGTGYGLAIDGASEEKCRAPLA